MPNQVPQQAVRRGHHPRNRAERRAVNAAHPNKSAHTSRNDRRVKEVRS